jgi:hypothetical protein
MDPLSLGDIASQILRRALLGVDGRIIRVETTFPYSVFVAYQDGVTYASGR